MTKLAHITSRPNHEVGEKVLGLCGKEFKVKVLWNDVPESKPICRTCVDVALEAMTEADAMIVSIRRRAQMALVRMQMITDELNPEPGTILDAISLADVEHLEKQVGDALAKAEEKRVKETCTCTWTSMEIFEVDPNCPIHGGEDEPIREIEDVQLPVEDQEEK